MVGEPDAGVTWCWSFDHHSGAPNPPLATTAVSIRRGDESQGYLPVRLPDPPPYDADSTCGAIVGTADPQDNWYSHWTCSLAPGHRGLHQAHNEHTHPTPSVVWGTDLGDRVYVVPKFRSPAEAEEWLEANSS